MHPPADIRPAVAGRDREQAELAGALAGARAGHGQAVLQRSGQVWMVEWRGRRSTAPDSKGIRDLAVLFAHPGQPVPALELVEAAGGPPATAAGGSLGPVIDATARRAYQQRLADLDDELGEAEENADA